VSFFYPFPIKVYSSGAVPLCPAAIGGQRMVLQHLDFTGCEKHIPSSKKRQGTTSVVP
jgi:hypothetical protein